tara:strand:+ start:8609 stop:8776 length:168 start_codon:yes stop_codon:yes gene_type:complete
MSDRVVRVVVDVILIIFVFIWFQFMKWSMGFENTVLFAFALTVSELWKPKQYKDE